MREDSRLPCTGDSEYPSAPGGGRSKALERGDAPTDRRRNTVSAPGPTAAGDAAMPAPACRPPLWPCMPPHPVRYQANARLCQCPFLMAQVPD